MTPSCYVRTNNICVCRFVDWFSSRGEAYEHNLNVVEKQIETLAVNSMPSRRQPYDGTLRFNTDTG
jgi:hypothetical protein